MKNMIQCEGLINPTIEEVVEFLGDRVVEADRDSDNIKYLDFDGMECDHWIDSTKTDKVIVEESNGQLYSVYIRIGTFSNVTKNDEPESITPTISEGTHTQRVFGEAITEHECNCSCKSEANPSNSEDRNTINRLLDIVEIFANR